MSNKHFLDLHCSSCTHLSCGKCYAKPSHPFVHSLQSCPLGKWTPPTHSSKRRPILWITQDFAQGGITSYLTYTAPHLAVSDTPILGIIYGNDFKFDHDRAKITSKYCPLYLMGTEPQSLYEEAEILTMSYVYHDVMMDYFPSRINRKEYHSLVYQTHGECEFTRQSARKQSILGQHVKVKDRGEDAWSRTVPSDLFDTSTQMPAIWGMGPTPYAQQMLEDEVKVPSQFSMLGKLITYPLYYGVDQDLYHIRCPRPFFSTKHPRYSPEPYRFICMGRLDPLKQYNLSAKLVDDFRKENQHYPPFANARLSMVGDGWGKDEVYASLAPYDFIDYYPWIDMKELVPIIQSHDMMLMHSSSEGGPLITIECLSCGLPVHSTPVGIHSALSHLDPQKLLFTSDMQPLTSFVRSTQSIDSHIERYRIIEQIRRVYSKSTLRFS